MREDEPVHDLGGYIIQVLLLVFSVALFDGRIRFIILKFSPKRCYIYIYIYIYIYSTREWLSITENHNRCFSEVLLLCNVATRWSLYNSHTAELRPTAVVWNLGIFFDADVSMRSHVMRSIIIFRHSATTIRCIRLSVPRTVLQWLTSSVGWTMVKCHTVWHHWPPSSTFSVCDERHRHAEWSIRRRV